MKTMAWRLLSLLLFYSLAVVWADALAIPDYEVTLPRRESACWISIKMLEVTQADGVLHQMLHPKLLRNWKSFRKTLTLHEWPENPELSKTILEKLIKKARIKAFKRMTCYAAPDKSKEVNECQETAIGACSSEEYKSVTLIYGIQQLQKEKLHGSLLQLSKPEKVKIVLFIDCQNPTDMDMNENPTECQGGIRLDFDPTFSKRFPRAQIEIRSDGNLSDTEIYPGGLLAREKVKGNFLMTLEDGISSDCAPIGLIRRMGWRLRRLFPKKSGPVRGIKATNEGVVLLDSDFEKLPKMAAKTCIFKNTTSKKESISARSLWIYREDEYATVTKFEQKLQPKESVEVKFLPLIEVYPFFSPPKPLVEKSAAERKGSGKLVYFNHVKLIKLEPQKKVEKVESEANKPKEGVGAAGSETDKREEEAEAAGSKTDKPKEDVIHVVQVDPEKDAEAAGSKTDKPGKDVETVHAIQIEPEKDAEADGAETDKRKKDVEAVRDRTDRLNHKNWLLKTITCTDEKMDTIVDKCLNAVTGDNVFISSGDKGFLNTTINRIFRTPEEPDAKKNWKAYFEDLRARFKFIKVGEPTTDAKIPDPVIVPLPGLVSKVKRALMRGIGKAKSMFHKLIGWEDEKIPIHDDIEVQPQPKRNMEGDFQLEVALLHAYRPLRSSISIVEIASSADAEPIICAASEFETRFSGDRYNLYLRKKEGIESQDSGQISLESAFQRFWGKFIKSSTKRDQTVKRLLRQQMSLKSALLKTPVLEVDGLKYDIWNYSEITLTPKDQKDDTTNGDGGDEKKEGETDEDEGKTKEGTGKILLTCENWYPEQKTDGEKIKTIEIENQEVNISFLKLDMRTTAVFSKLDLPYTTKHTLD